MRRDKPALAKTQGQNLTVSERFTSVPAGKG
jgi:hypothetical protein